MTMTDPADIFSRTRALTGELSAAILAAGTHSVGIERARTECNLLNMEGNNAEMGRLLRQALVMHRILSRQIWKEPRADVVDMRGIGIGRRG